MDLGDRSELIDLVYGPPKEKSISSANSTSTVNQEVRPTITPSQSQYQPPPSQVTNTITRENGKNERLERIRERKEKKKSGKIACSCCTIFFLFLLALLAIAFSGFAAYWFTKKDYENRMSMTSYVPFERRNMSFVDDAPPLDEEEPEKDVRMPSLQELALPDNVKPSGYNVSLKIPLNASMPIEGNVLIRLNIVEQTDKIVLHGKKLVLPSPSKIRLLAEPKTLRKRQVEQHGNTTFETSAEEPEDVVEQGNEETQELVQEVKKPYSSLVPIGVNVMKITLNDTLEKVFLTLDKPLNPGEVVLQFPFETKPSLSATGAFLTSYKNADGTTSTGLSLAGNSRRLFPSFDEKRFAAPLTLSIIHPKGTSVISNGPGSDIEEIEPGWLQTTIEKPSTANTALNIFQFDKKADQAKNDKDIRVWGRPDTLNTTDFALETAVNIVNLLQTFYATELPTQSLDIVAVPGLLTGQSLPGQIQLPERDVLYDSMADDILDKVYIVEQLSQQINKQFIGDIVPSSESSSKWIEEALAHFVVKNALDSFFGSTEATNQHILVNSLEKSLALDSQSSSHPLSADFDTLRESTIINEVVSKEKGAAVLRMVQSIMGKDAFRDGIRNFFTSTQRGNASYTDLWISLQSSVPKELKAWDGNNFNVADFANKWVMQMGYPVVELYRMDPSTIEITQHRFKLDRTTPELNKFRNAVYWYKWDIPLKYWINGDVKDMKWLHEALRLPVNMSDEIVINGNADGYYRVNYDEESWQDIANIFNNEHGLLSASARARVLSDVFALSAANVLPYKVAFNVTDYLNKEDSYAPIAVVLNGFLDIYNRLDDSDEANKAKEYILEKINNQFQNLPDYQSLTTQNDQDYLRIKKDLTIVEVYCRLHHEKCRKQFSSLSEEKLIKPCADSNFTSQCSIVPPALRWIIYCDTVAYGDDGVFNLFIDYAKNEPYANEKRRIVAALGCSRDPLAIRRLLKNSLTNSTKLARDDIPIFLRSLSNSDVGSLIVSDFLLDNWKNLREKLSDDVYTLSTALTNGLRPSNRRQIKLLEAFAQEHPGAKTFGSFRNQLEKGRSILEWQRKNSEELTQLFNEL